MRCEFQNFEKFRFEAFPFIKIPYLTQNVIWTLIRRYTNVRWTSKQRFEACKKFYEHNKFNVFWTF